MKTDYLEKVADYESVVDLANKCQDSLDERSIQKIHGLINDLKSPDDPVFQVNCLQLVADLACSKQGLAILDAEQVPEELIAILNDSDPLIVPHALKFFYRVNPEHLETRYPQVLNKICDYCQSENKQLLDYAIDFVASIGRGGYSARRVLDRYDQFKERCLSTFGSTILCSDALLKSRALRCIADLLEIHEEDPKEESSKLSERFYHAINEGENRMTNHLLSLCKYPFMEIRVNALQIVAIVAGFDWAQRELAAHPDFVRWILDRSTERCKEGKEAKFEILRAIVKSRTACSIFKSEDYMKMRADFKNGPFHVGVAEEMLMDQQSAG